MPPSALSFLDDFLDDDEFTELTDAVIHRVDLVASPANGRGFVITKAAAGGGLVPPTAVRSLIKQGEQPMTASTGGKRTYRVVKGSNGKPQLAVYDETGKLIGTVDPADITELQTSDDKNDQAAQEANAARVQAQHDPNAKASDELTKSLSECFRGLKPRPGQVRKASIGTVTEGWTELMKALDPGRENAVKGIVSSGAMKFMINGAPPATSVGVAKRAAVQLARQQGLI